MCGIAGFINTAKREINADDFCRNSFVAGSLRGMDSSGIASIDTKQGYSSYHKLPILGSYFIGDKVASDIIREASDANTITICHTRAATIGKVEYQTAHPFKIDIEDEESGIIIREFVGVHNGTLHQWSTKKEAKAYKVDSEWALNHICDNGLDAFKDFKGAFCFVWWDSDKQEVLNIARNDQRTMYVALTKEGNMAYASEAGMLAWLCERNNITIEGAIKALEPGYLFQFDAANPSKFTKEALPEEEKSAVASYPSTNTNNYYSNGNYSSHRTVPSTMQKVEELIKKITDKVKLLPSPTSKDKVTEEEISNASILGIHNVRGAFIPSYKNNDDAIIYGSYSYGDGTELEAIMRDAEGVDIGPNTMFTVDCLGVIDDPQELTVIVSTPVTTRELVH